MLYDDLSDRKMIELDNLDYRKMMENKNCGLDNLTGRKQGRQNVEQVWSDGIENERQKCEWSDRADGRHELVADNGHAADGWVCG